MHALILSILFGPLSPKEKKTKILASLFTVFLTVLTQVGGIILWPFWGIVLRLFSAQLPHYRFLSRMTLLFFIYLVGTLVIVPVIAKQTGRVRLPMYVTDSLPLGPLTIAYPLLNRNYVRPHTYDAFVNAVQKTKRSHPDIIVRYLDANFPFPFMPLLPHMSHYDGQKIDVAFQFQKDGAYHDGARSPIGYWGYAKESKKRCQGFKSPYIVPLRWDFDWLQPLLPDLNLDVKKNRALFSALSKDKRVCSILLEPTLHKLLSSPKLLPNKCKVARHDDHFHLTIRSKCSKN